MRLTRARIPELPGEGFFAPFPGPGGPRGTEPVAMASFAAAGDMRFADPRCAADRERFLRGAGLDPAAVRGLELSHSRNVLFPSAGEDTLALARASGGADGLVLRDRSLAASITVADCMPIWILDRGSGAFGVLHSGWRGTGILEAAVRGMEGRLGSDPSSIAVILGPAIGPCCYEVSADRAETYSSEFGAESVSRRGLSFYLDLRSANVSMADRLGVGDLLSIDSCTSCDSRLGSFRRQGGDRFTRMLAVCGMASVDLPASEARPASLVPVESSS